MKSFFRKLGYWFVAMGEARYATWHARNGRIEKAKDIMNRQ